MFPLNSYAEHNNLLRRTQEPFGFKRTHGFIPDRLEGAVEIVGTLTEKSVSASVSVSEYAKRLRLLLFSCAPSGGSFARVTLPTIK